METILKFKLEKLPDYFVYISAAALLLNELTKSVFKIAIIDSESTIFAIFAFALVALVASVGRKLDRILHKIEEANDLSDESGENHLTPAEFATRIRSCNQIDILTLSGTKSVAIGDEQVTEAICDPRSKCRIRILLANPDSVHIQNRYALDESDAYEAGTSGIRRKLLQLAKLLDENESVRNRVEIKVFDNYPTVSIARFDDDFFSSVYGFKLRGSDCPRLHARKGTQYADFLVKHFDRVHAASMPLVEWKNTTPNSEEKI